MNNEIYEKLGGIYGGQKELIDDVINAFDELQKRINKAIEYVKNTYDDSVSAFTENKPMTNFKARCELIKILKGEENE